MIPPRNLALLSNRLSKAGRRIPEAVLDRDYCLAWFLVALSRTPLRERLAFKGGTAIKRCYFGDYRFSEDLDFTLAAETGFDTIRRELDAVFSEVARATGAVFRFAREDRRTHENSYTFYLGYEGPLPAPAGGREVKVDITIRELLVFPLEDRQVLRAYEEYADLPRDAMIRVYSLDEIASEKVVALMDRARNEPRDLYDLWYLATGRHVDVGDLGAAVKRKWEFRGKKLADVRGEFLAKEGRYRKLWEPRLASQMVALPGFTEVYRSVRRALRQAGLSGR
jgi:predicted nucleotidyltransferase component of viral defense system